MVVWFLMACAQPQEDDVLALMDEKSLLRRLSIDIRGILPSQEEYLQLEERKALDFVDDFLYDPFFGERVRGIFADYYRTEIDSYGITNTDVGIISQGAFREAIGQESLRILQEVAESDVSWTEIVTADWTMANEVSAQIFSLDYEGTGWQRTRYTDGRPHAGVLATGSMWLRYTSTISNANRNSNQ